MHSEEIKQVNVSPSLHISDFNNKCINGNSFVSIIKLINKKRLMCKHKYWRNKRLLIKIKVKAAKMFHKIGRFIYVLTFI